MNRKLTDLQTLKQRAFAQRRKPMIEILESRRLLSAGDLDTTFSGDGKQTTDLGSAEQANKVLVQSDGKIVVAGAGNGDARLVRYNANGTLDTSFSDDGVARQSWNGTENFTDAVLLPDGKILVGGNHNGGWWLARYRSNGTLDANSGFGGTDGIQSGSGRISELELQGTKIITADGSGNVRRHNANGSIDTTFGSGGTVNVNAVTAANEFTLSELVVQSDGKILVGGASDGSEASPETWAAIARLNANGTVDSGFATGGLYRTEFDSAASTVNGLALQSGGKIIAVITDGGPDANFVRLNPNGTEDATFANGPFFGGVDSPNGLDVAIDDQQRIVISGDAFGSASDSEDFYVGRFTPNGADDTSFSGDGHTLINMGGPEDFARAGVALAPNGAIVVAGVAQVERAGGSDARIAVARLQGGGTVTPPDDNIFKDSAGVVHGIGASGNDVLGITGGGSTITVTVNGESETFTGVTGGRLDGLAGNDRLSDNGGGQSIQPPVTLVGGDGDDQFVTFHEQVTILGGAGNDGVRVPLGGHVPNLFDAGAGSGDVINIGNAGFIDLNDHPGLENAFGEFGIFIGNALDNQLFVAEGGELYGNGGNDELAISSVGGILEGGDGNDFLHVGNPTETNTTTFTLNGGAGNDSLVGGTRNDRLIGGIGNDTLTGGAGRDSISGDAGDDVIFARDGEIDTLDGGAGNDRAEGNSFDIVTNVETFDSDAGDPVYIEDRVVHVDGTTGNDTIVTDGGLFTSERLTVTLNGATFEFDQADFDRILIRGFAGNDSFEDRSRYDTVFEGGEGNDFVDTFNDEGGRFATVFGGAGDDVANFDDAPSTTGPAVFDGGTGRDRIVRPAFLGDFDLRDFPTVEDAVIQQGTLHGNSLNNDLTVQHASVVFGHGGNDTLHGSDDEDALFGGSGNDRIMAGAGDDYIEGNLDNDTLYGEAGADEILGHQGNDYFWVREGEADTLDGGVGNYDRAQVDSMDTATNMEAFIP